MSKKIFDKFISSNDFLKKIVIFVTYSGKRIRLLLNLERTFLLSALRNLVNFVSADNK